MVEKNDRFALINSINFPYLLFKNFSKYNRNDTVDSISSLSNIYKIILCIEIY